MVIWIYTGEVNSKRIREKYLQAILRQDIAYFDTVGAGEVATRIQTDTRMYLYSLLLPFSPRPSTDLVQRGISEKVGLIVSFIASFITGFVIAYASCWRLALAMSSIFPCIVVAGGVMGKFMTKSSQFVFFPSLLAFPSSSSP